MYFYLVNKNQIWNFWKKIANQTRKKWHFLSSTYNSNTIYWTENCCYINIKYLLWYYGPLKLLISFVMFFINTNTVGAFFTTFGSFKIRRGSILQFFWLPKDLRLLHLCFDFIYCISNKFRKTLMVVHDTARPNRALNLHLDSLSCNIWKSYANRR